MDQEVTISRMICPGKCTLFLGYRSMLSRCNHACSELRRRLLGRRPILFQRPI